MLSVVQTHRVISKMLAGKEVGERQRRIIFGNASVYSSAKNYRPVTLSRPIMLTKFMFLQQKTSRWDDKNSGKLHRNVNRFYVIN